jgi:hypothetical protein
MRKELCQQRCASTLKQLYACTAHHRGRRTGCRARMGAAPTAGANSGAPRPQREHASENRRTFQLRRASPKNRLKTYSWFTRVACAKKEGGIPCACRPRQRYCYTTAIASPCHDEPCSYITLRRPASAFAACTDCQNRRWYSVGRGSSSHLTRVPSPIWCRCTCEIGIVESTGA